jgi:hypothetical protein
VKLLALQFVILGWAIAAFADNLENFSLNTNQAAVMKLKLEAFDKGQFHRMRWLQIPMRNGAAPIFRTQLSGSMGCSNADCSSI